MKPESDEHDLKQWFDATAEAPDAATLSRLLGAAERGERPPARSKLATLWAPVLIAAAAGTALVLRSAAPGEPAALATLPTSAPNAAHSAVVSTRSSASPATTDSADELGHESDGDEGADVLDDLALDPGDLSEAELDAWISAASSTLDG